MTGSISTLAAERPLGPAPSPKRRNLTHPFVLCRVAGLPLASAMRLQTETSYLLAARLMEAEPQVAQRVGEACDRFATLIASPELTPGSRRRLIDLKRDLYNRRAGRAATLLAELGSEIPAEAAGLAADAIDSTAAYLDLEQAFATAHADDLAHASGALRAACLSSETFLKALAFSALSLTSDLLRSQHEPDRFTGKAGRELDRSLFNYFMRASVKVSPLTWFTPVVAGRWDREGEAPLALGERPAAARAELSRRCVMDLLAALNRKLSFWGEDHPLALNPTLSRVGGAWQFYDLWAEGVERARTWGVNQPLVQMAATARVNALVAAFHGAGGPQPTPLTALRARLDTALFDGPRQRDAYVAQAMRAGLVAPVLDLTEQGDAVSFLVRALDQRLPAAAERLQAITTELKSFEVAGHAERLASGRALGGAYRELCVAVGARHELSAKTPLFYEDCRLEGGPLTVADPRLGAVVDDLHRLSAVFPLLDYNHVIQCVLGGLFRARFGAGAVVKAEECLQALADEAQSIALRVTSRPLGEQAVELLEISANAGALALAKQAFLTELHELLQQPGDLQLSEAFLRRHEGAIPPAVRARPASYTIIGQLCTTEAGPGFTLNRIYSGHCTLMSRFMRDVAPEDLASITQYLQALAPRGARLVELPGVFGFNANLHPPFVDSEIVLPGRTPNYPHSRKLSLSDITVRYDERFDRLAFETLEGEEVSFHYFGFLNLMVLPTLYQLLGRAHGQGLILDLWQDIVFAGLIDLGGERSLARVTYGDVVVSRRTAYMAPDSLPDPALPEAAFYRGLVEALAKAPALAPGADAYARLVADPVDFMGDGEGPPVAETTDFKPSYLSPRLPLSIASLRRKLARRRRGLLVQEALPTVTEGVEWNGRRHACEIQLEIARTALEEA